MSKDDNTSRARSRGEQTAGQRELKVLEAMGIMRSMRYRTGVTSVELAAKWGMALSSISGITSEASRRVRAEVNDPDLVSATIGSAMMDVVTNKDSERRDVIAAAAQWAKLAPGVVVPTKLEVSAVDNEQTRLEALAPKERAVELRAMATRLLAAADELEVEV